MKKILLSLILCGLAIPFVRAQINYSDYHLTFYEEFDYPDPASSYPSHAFKNTTGTIPVSVAGTTAGHHFRDFWLLTNGDWGAGNEYYTEKNTFLQSPGILRMTETSVPTPYQLPPPSNRWIHYNAGYLNLQPDMKDFSRNYGYGIVEASIRFPDLQEPEPNGTNKTCPISLWMWGWNNTEIDIFDVSFKNYYTTRVIDWFYSPNHGKSNTIGPGLSPAFHTLSAVWTPSIVRFYIDGNFINAVDYETIRSYPFFYALEIAIMPSLPHTPGQFMEIDWVKIWKPNCDKEDLVITERSGLGPFYRDHPASGRLFKQAQANISSTSGLLTMPNDVPTIIEAEATVIAPNFLADQSTLMMSTVAIDGGSKTQNANGYLEIIPIRCGSDDGRWYKQNTDDNSDAGNGGGNFVLSKGAALAAMNREGTTNKTAGGPENTYAEDKLLPAARVFPNPNNGAFTVQLAEPGEYIVRVLNSIGSVVGSYNITNERIKTIKLNEQLPSGNYMIQVTGNGIRYIEKIMVMH